jgi:hypothetical protein
MKRLLFASMIFCSVHVTAQTKAGKTDTVRHAVYYASTKPSTTPVLNLSIKEEAAQIIAGRKNAAAVAVPQKKYLKNMQPKEVMKAAVTGNSE